MADKKDQDLWRELEELRKRLDALTELVRQIGETVESLANRGMERRSRELAEAAVAPVAPNFRWIPATSDGWLVVLNAASARIALPSALKVDFTGTVSGRDQFTVMEGILKGEKCSVKTGFLVNVDPQTPAVKMVFKKAASPVTVDGKVYDHELTITHKVSGTDTIAGPFPAKTDPTNPVPAGTHDVEIPDAPHADGAQYGDFATVWFRIGHSGDRYVHPGRVSAGCVTVVPKHWKEIYLITAQARKDDVNIGTLDV